MNPSTDSGGDSKSPNSDSRGVKLWQWALKSPGSQAGVAETWYFQTLRTHDCHAEFKIIQKCNIKPLSNFLIWENRFQSHLKNRGQRGSRQNFLRPDLHIELCNSLIAALPAGDFCFLWGKIRAWNDSYQCYHCTRSGTAFCFRRCTKLLLETHTFFFFLNCAISLFLAALWTNSRVVLVILMSQESGKSACIWMLPSSGEFSANFREWRSGLQLISVGFRDTLHVHWDTQLVWHPWDVAVNKNWLEVFFLKQST